MEKKVLSVFSGEYWRTAAKEYYNLKTLCLAALCIALYVTLDIVGTIPLIPEILYIKTSFIASVICSFLCGPLVGIATGAVADILSNIIRPLGPFFPGYTLSSIIAFVIYSLLLYRKKVSVLKIVIAKINVNLFINVGLGCLWRSILQGKGYMVYFAESAIKNVVLVPFEVLLLVVLFRILLPVMTKMNLIPPQKKLYWISEREGHGI